MTREEMKTLAKAWAGRAKVELKFAKRPGGLAISGGGESVVFDGEETEEDFETELGYWFGGKTLGGNKCK